MGDVDRQQTTRKGKKPRIVVEDLEKGQKSYVVTMADARMAVIALSGGKNVSPYAIKNAMHRGDVLLGRFRVYNIGQKTRLTKDTKPIPKGKRRLRIKKRLDPKSAVAVQSVVNAVSNLSSATESVNNAQPNLARDAGVPLASTTEEREEPTEQANVSSSLDADERAERGDEGANKRRRDRETMFQEIIAQAEDEETRGEMAEALDPTNVQLNKVRRVLEEPLQQTPVALLEEEEREKKRTREQNTFLDELMSRAQRGAPEVIRQVGAENVQSTKLPKIEEPATQEPAATLLDQNQPVQERPPSLLEQLQTGRVNLRRVEDARDAEDAQQSQMETEDTSLNAQLSSALDNMRPQLKPDDSDSDVESEWDPDAEDTQVVTDQAQATADLVKLIGDVEEREGRVREKISADNTEGLKYLSEIRNRIIEVRRQIEAGEKPIYQEVKAFFDKAFKNLLEVPLTRPREDGEDEDQQGAKKAQKGFTEFDGSFKVPIQDEPQGAAEERDELLDQVLDEALLPGISSTDEFLKETLKLVKESTDPGPYSMKVADVTNKLEGRISGPDKARILEEAFSRLENPKFNIKDTSRLFVLNQVVYYLDVEKTVALIDEIGVDIYNFLLFSSTLIVLPDHLFRSWSSIVSQASNQRHVLLERDSMLSQGFNGDRYLRESYKVDMSDLVPKDQEPGRYGAEKDTFFEYRPDNSVSLEVFIKRTSTQDYAFNFSRFLNDLETGGAQQRSKYGDATSHTIPVSKFYSLPQNRFILLRYLEMVDKDQLSGSGLLDTQGVSAEMGVPQVKTSEGILDEIAVLHSGHVNKRARTNLMQEDIKLVDTSLGTRAVGKQTMKKLYDNFRRPHARDEDNSMPSDEYRAATKVPYRTRARTVSRNVNGLPIGNQAVDFDVEMTPQGAVLRSRANPFYTVPISSTTGRQFLLQRRQLPQVLSTQPSVVGKKRSLVEVTEPVKEEMPTEESPSVVPQVPVEEEKKDEKTFSESGNESDEEFIDQLNQEFPQGIIPSPPPGPPPQEQEATLEGTGIRGTRRVLNRIRPRVHAPN